MTDKSTPISVTALPRLARTHPAPQLSHLVTSSYAPPKGPKDQLIESNLLILFHGLGDSHTPFFRFGQSLSLPQTAVLSIRAPLRVPLLEEEAWQWWPSFDQLGEVIPSPNPTVTFRVLTQVLDHLLTVCNWHPAQLHFFGNSQGATCAAELILKYFNPTFPSPITFGSLISISGPLISFPTRPARNSTKVLLVSRKTQESILALPNWKKGFEKINSHVLPLHPSPMPTNDKEWFGIIKFWSQVLLRRSPMEFEKDVYAVSSDSVPGDAARPPKP
ncbi:BQ5605_C028g10472 [Microbotryum silenes-dioicae]|uniref:BQ5605_C028g10472 protein n=1 Tax=Microbotryum silenes-dioicae TaxID=796604 RepID=A0A2X0MIM6_9BASI|nr:BQ5605_C028g10472 [Microbotryum silenes-dioicae]